MMSFRTIEFGITDGNFSVMSSFLGHNSQEKISENIKFEEPEEISIMLHDTKPICRKRKPPEDIDIYTLGKNNISFQKFEYGSKKFSFKIESEKCRTYFNSGIKEQPYLRLILQYEDKGSLEKMMKEAGDFYKKYIDSKKRKEDEINIWTNEGVYFCNKTTLKKKDPKSLYLSEEKRKIIFDIFETYVKEETRELYKELDIPDKIVVMLYGPPGTGKTTTIQSIASKLNRNICFYTRDPELSDTQFNRLLENTEEEEDEGKSILVLEDMDCIFNVKDREDKKGICLGSVLNCLDGFSRKNDIIIITTNDKNGMDPALIRPGRIDHMIELTHADEEQVRQMYKKFMLKTYSEEMEEVFIKEYKKIKVKVSTSLLQSFFFKYVGDHPGVMKNIGEIKKIKELVDPGNENRIYC